MSHDLSQNCHTILDPSPWSVTYFMDGPKDYHRHPPPLSTGTGTVREKTVAEIRQTLFRG